MTRHALDIDPEKQPSRGYGHLIVRVLVVNTLEVLDAIHVIPDQKNEVRQLYELRIEFELLALRWAKLRVSEEDLAVLEKIVEAMAEAGIQKKAKEFFQFDLDFHRHCWKFSGNKFLTRSLEGLVPPLFAFVLNASDETVHESVARQHSNIIDALRSVANRTLRTPFARRSAPLLSSGFRQ